MSRSIANDVSAPMSLSRIVVVLASAKLAMHLATVRHYPLHRDERMRPASCGLCLA